MFSALPSKTPTPSNAGFSVVELMVTISIIVIVTGLSLVRYSDFNNTILLKSQAYEIAFDIRQAQMSGISVRNNDGGAARNGYGISFSNLPTSSYYFFLDSDDGNAWYDGESEIVDTFFVDPRFAITDICVTIDGSEHCSQSAVSILFRRPNFDAIITNSDGGDSRFSATIVIEPAADSSVSRQIKIYRSGQITVE